MTHEASAAQLKTHNEDGVAHGGIAKDVDQNSEDIGKLERRRR